MPFVVVLNDKKKRCSDHESEKMFTVASEKRFLNCVATVLQNVDFDIQISE